MSELSETSVVYKAKTCSLKADEELESQLNLYALEQFDEAVSSISEVENLLSQTMQKLPERCREIFLLSRIEGLKYKEIAEQPGYIRKHR